MLVESMHQACDTKAFLDGPAFTVRCWKTISLMQCLHRVLPDAVTAAEALSVRL